jgi:hypothetical protein
MTDPSELVPAFTTDVEPTDGGAPGAAAQLDAFAVEHRVGERTRERLAAVTADVLERLVAGRPGSEPILVEADIDQGSVQVVFTRDLGTREAVTEAQTRLADTASSCDGFAVQRAGDGATIEVWICFALS